MQQDNYSAIVHDFTVLHCTRQWPKSNGNTHASVMISPKKSEKKNKKTKQREEKLWYPNQKLENSLNISNAT